MGDLIDLRQDVNLEELLCLSCLEPTSRFFFVCRLLILRVCTWWL